MTDITVGICTFRRESLAATLLSIEAQSVRPVRILVIDNDDEPSARERVDALKEKLRTSIDYYHIPGRNIAAARNAVLERTDTRFLAFIDDDEIAATGWLEGLMDALTDDSAAVMGPMIAAYPEEAPGWMRRVAPHSQLPVIKDGVLINGHTANCLIDLAHPAFACLRFDTAFGRLGGSDSMFFMAARKRGAQFAHAPGAVVTEAVAPERMSLDWLLRRRWRIGQALARQSDEARPVFLAKSLAKTGYCLADALLHLAAPAGRYRALLRASMHMGSAAAALGVPMKDWYGHAVTS